MTLTKTDLRNLTNEALGTKTAEKTAEISNLRIRRNFSLGVAALCFSAMLVTPVGLLCAANAFLFLVNGVIVNLQESKLGVLREEAQQLKSEGDLRAELTDAVEAGDIAPEQALKRVPGLQSSFAIAAEKTAKNTVASAPKNKLSVEL